MIKKSLIMDILQLCGHICGTPGKKMKHPMDWQQLVTSAFSRPEHGKTCRYSRYCPSAAWSTVKESDIDNYELTEEAGDLNAMAVLSSHPPIQSPTGIFYWTNKCNC